LDDCIPFGGWFFRDDIQPKPEELVGKGLTAARSAQVAQEAMDILEGLPSWKAEVAEPAMRAYLEMSGLGPNQVFGILRTAVTGQMVSPPLFESMEVVGREKVLERIRRAIGTLRGM
jgi:glutamyl-tRNA synthetase